MYPITYNGIEGQTGLYALIRRKLDGKYWGLTWGDQVSQVAIPLTEDLNIPGLYTGNADFNPSNGGIYVVSVFTSGGVLLLEMDCLFKSRQKTIIELIKDVQRWLRFAEAGVITEGHAQLLLGFANEVQLDYMAEYTWEEMKVKGAFAAVPGIAVYAIAPLSSGIVETIKELRIGASEPMTKPDEDMFNAFVRSAPLDSQPLYYSHYGRAGASLIIEISPVPDVAYRVDFELLQKPAELVNAEDVPLLDQDVIKLGMKYLAKKDMGEDFNPELQTFQAKLSLKIGSHGESENAEIDFL